jgi:hypothetical protein
VCVISAIRQKLFRTTAIRSNPPFNFQNQQIQKPAVPPQPLAPFVNQLPATAQRAFNSECKRANVVVAGAWLNQTSFFMTPQLLFL